VYLLGARQEVLDRALRWYRRRDPDLRVVGHHHGYFDPEEEARIAEEIRDSGAQLLFIGISSPKKERFVARQRSRLESVPFVLGVGGAFDIAAGRTRRAPRWMARAGLEWTYRLAQEPRRLARRYLVDDLGFFRLVALQLLGTPRRRGSVVEGRGDDLRR